MATKAETIEMLKEGRGCLGKAADDEPVFILRAQDALAPDVIDYWANKVFTKARTTDVPKAKEAIAEAHEMRAWQARNKSKLPD